MMSTLTASTGMMAQQLMLTPYQTIWLTSILFHIKVQNGIKDCLMKH